MDPTGNGVLTWKMFLCCFYFLKKKGWVNIEGVKIFTGICCCCCIFNLLYKYWNFYADESSWRLLLLFCTFCLFVCLLLLLFAAVVVMGEGWEEYKRLVSFCHKSMWPPAFMTIFSPNVFVINVLNWKFWCKKEHSFVNQQRRRQDLVTSQVNYFRVCSFGPIPE